MFQGEKEQELHRAAKRKQEERKGNGQKPHGTGNLTDDNKGKRNIDKTKFPYNLQPIDKYLRKTQYDIPQELTTECSKKN